MSININELIKMKNEVEDMTHYLKWLNENIEDSESYERRYNEIRKERDWLLQTCILGSSEWLVVTLDKKLKHGGMFEDKDAEGLRYQIMNITDTLEVIQDTLEKKYYQELYQMRIILLNLLKICNKKVYEQCLVENNLN